VPWVTAWFCPAFHNAQGRSALAAGPMERYDPVAPAVKCVGRLTTNMRVPKVHGVIRRRLLINFRADPDVVQNLLPQPFSPKLHGGNAIVGVCLIRLEHIRLRGMPTVLGVSSENAAHRFAVTWSQGGIPSEGVYIPRRDTSSLFNHLVGGRLFPGEHHRAGFRVAESTESINLSMQSMDHQVELSVRSSVAPELPNTSIFRSLREVSAFFEAGSLGYSSTAAGDHLDGVILRTARWHVEPLRVEQLYSSYFADATRFPKGSIAFDCALLMRNIGHEWHSAASLYT